MRPILLALCLLLPRALSGQAGPTPNTLSLDPAAPRPAASLADLAWLAGHWRGPALGGTSEEIWSGPEGGSMMGVYRLIKGDSIVFYEIVTIQPDGPSLVMKLKHFNADLTGWEEKDEVRAFRLVKLTPTEAFFEGMTLRLLDPDRLQVQLAIRMRDGSVREEEFRYTRVRQASPR